MTASLKHLSSAANDVVQRCALKVGESVERLVEEFEEDVWKAEMGNYSRKFIEFCCGKALNGICQSIQDDVNNGSFSRFTYDMMLAWEAPTPPQEDSNLESVAKEKEERKAPTKVVPELDEVPLFYSDLMPLLVDNEPDVGEDAFVWLASLCALVSDIVNGRFTFETLTAPTGNRLHFPSYDKFLKEIDKSVKQLQNQATPKGVTLADDEFILHVEGTATTQRVVRHIGGTSWPGRLTLTNYSLYFETSGIISYEDAIKIDLSKDIEHSVKPAATGPWGAPLYDKAIVYESPEISEGIVLEFPEMTSSTRRDHWLALTKEIKLLHRFLSKYKVENLAQAWEMHARTILGIIRLHAARELLRISPPTPTKFLIFALCDEVPKGDYILEELAESLKNVNSGHPCSATSILRSLNMSHSVVSSLEIKEVCKEIGSSEVGLSPLETAVNQAREEEKETSIAKATAKELKDEGLSESVLTLLELLKPLKSMVPILKQVLTWERPATTLLVLAAAVVTIYKEWVGKALAAILLWITTVMLQARRHRINEKCKEIIVCTASEQTTMESIVSAQQGVKTVHELVQTANVAILKIWSIFVSKAPKHADLVMMAMVGIAIVLAVVPTKVIIMAVTLHLFIMNSKIGKYVGNGDGRGDRRLKEWWDSIPVIRVRVVDNLSEKST